jgi:hypothetical protein
VRAFALMLVMGSVLGAEPTFAPQDRPALPRGMWVWAEVTSYCGGPCATCQTTGVTASNHKTLHVPYNLASDRKLRLGTLIYVPPGLGVLDTVRAGQRMFQVDDRGGALDSESLERGGILRLDLRVKEHWWAKAFGRRLLPVYIVSP